MVIKPETANIIISITTVSLKREKPRRPEGRAAGQMQGLGGSLPWRLHHEQHSHHCAGGYINTLIWNG